MVANMVLFYVGARDIYPAEKMGIRLEMHVVIKRKGAPFKPVWRDILLKLREIES